MKKYDLIVIGAGSGGLNVAAFMNTAKFRVLLIDKTDKSIGGDCLNTGCVPSKALIAHAAKVHAARSIGCTPKVDLAQVMQTIRDIQDDFRTHESAAWFRKQGMDVVLGEASFSAKNTVVVKGKTYTGKKILIATGTKPRRVDLGAPTLTNEEIFSLKTLPKSLVVLGAGPIGIELAQAFARLGSDVTILHRGTSILKKEDAEIAQRLQGQLLQEGVHFVFEETAKKYDGNILTLQSGKKIHADQVLCALGREIALPGGLEKAGIQTANGKLIVDDYLRTTNKHVLVAGDAAGGPQFTHAAEVHARVLITNFFSPFKKKITYDTFAWVTYTDPQIATFGVQTGELVSLDHAEDDKTKITQSRGLTKVWLKNEKIVGGTMLAHDAGELVQELILAMEAKIPVSTFLAKTYPYPVHTRVNKRLFGQYLGKKLTPLAKRVMRVLY